MPSSRVQRCPVGCAVGRLLDRLCEPDGKRDAQPGPRPDTTPLRAAAGGRRLDVGADRRSPCCAWRRWSATSPIPTYPTYDSFYALLWGRDLLHLHLPDFRVYRGPTEHPLAIAFGMVCSIFGQGGARLMVLGSIASFVAVVAGIYRLGRLCFGPVVGLVAALLVLSRFFVENLAAQGYLDISYVALIVWAVVLEVQRPRRGTLVLADCSPPPGCCAPTRGC